MARTCIVQGAGHGGLLTTMISALSRGSPAPLFSRSNSLIVERTQHTKISPTNSLNADGPSRRTSHIPTSGSADENGGLPTVRDQLGVRFRSASSFLSVDYGTNHVTWAPGSGGGTPVGAAVSPVGSSDTCSQYSHVRFEPRVSWWISLQALMPPSFMSCRYRLISKYLAVCIRIVCLVARV